MDLQMKDEMADVLDVEDLLARCLGNMEFAQRILGKFQERCDEDLAALERAVGEDDRETVARLAHRLKGASANASAPGLRRHASEIESAARRQAFDELPACLEKLKREWDRFGTAACHLGAPLRSPAYRPDREEGPGSA